MTNYFLHGQKVKEKKEEGRERRRKDRRRRREKEREEREEREEELGFQCLHVHALVTGSPLKSSITSQQCHKLGTEHLRQGPLGDSYPSSSRADPVALRRNCDTFPRAEL